MIVNNKACMVIRIGRIKLKMFDGVGRTLTEVKCVSELKRNLILLGNLESKGYRFKATCGVLSVTKGPMVVIEGERVKNLYWLKENVVQVELDNGEFPK